MNSMTSEWKRLYRFRWDCDRMGVVESMFIASAVAIDAAIGKQVGFGEILGKHSNIEGILGEEDLVMLSEDQDFIEELEHVVGGTLLCGPDVLAAIVE